jgi:basic membrane protein A and related proteins
MRHRARARWLVVAVPAGAVAALAIGASTAGGASVETLGIVAPEKGNDYGWNQQGVQGAEAAGQAQGAKVVVDDGIGYENIEPNLRRMAQRGANLIIAQASGYNTVAPKVAAQFNVPVIVYDRPQAKKKGLVANINTSSQQGAYLAGVLAAQMTKTGTLGIVLSAADTNWYKQAGGFAAGARSVKKDVKFRTAQIGQAGYSDAAGGKRVTQSVIAAGADVVFGMGDGSSFGMLQAVETAKPPAPAKKVFFIDVIGNKQKIDKKGVLLSSVLWDFTPLFTDAIKAVDAGTFGTVNYNMTVKNGISLLKTNKAPASAWAKVNAAKAGIQSGKITVPLTPTKAALDRLLK